MNGSAIRENGGSWKKNAALFLIGQGLSLFGSMLVSYAIMWHVTLKTQSGSVITLFTIAAVLPMFFISPFGGVWADRYNRKYLINLSDSAIALITLVMAVMFFLGFEHVGLLFVCSVARGLGQGVQMPAVNALIPQIVPEQSLTKVNGVNSSIQSLCMFASPMLAGAVLSVAPIEAILFIDVVTAILGVCIVFFLVKVPARVKCAEAAGAPGDYFHDLKEGIAYIRRHDFIKHFLLFAAVFNIMASPAALLTPLQVTRNFGADVWRLTAIEIAFSLGMLLGGLIMSLWGGFGNRTHSMALATALFGLETIGLGLLGNFWVYLACMGVLGLSMPLFSTPMTAILQSKVDEAYMGRVFSVMMMISSVAMPLSMVVFGPLGDIIAIDFLLIGTGAIIFLLSFTIIGSRSLREAGRSS